MPSEYTAPGAHDGERVAGSETSKGESDEDGASPPTRWIDMS